MDLKKVFISYSWGDKAHQDWVQNLGTRLINDGIDVTLDRWSAKEGHDITFFMETMVKKDLYDRVLIISDEKYSKKADNRDGGVGVETQIITPSIYSDGTQEKFLPLVVERDENDEPCLPVFLKSRLYFDFSKEEYFEETYENLVRNIYDAPQIVKPKLGNKPSYITDDRSIVNSNTSFLVRSLENQLSKNPNRINSLAQEFIDDFKSNLFEFRLNLENGITFLDAGKKSVDKIHEYRNLREDFIQFLQIITKTEYNFDVDIVKSLFEEKDVYNRPQDVNLRSWSTAEYQHYKFIFHELFIYVVAICLKNQNYNALAEFLHSPYFYQNSNIREIKAQKFIEIREHPEILNEYYIQEFRKISGSAELMISNLSDKLNKQLFIQADLLLHYIDELNNNDVLSYKKWFPVTYIYKDEGLSNTFFSKLVSKKYFEKLKVVFDVEDIESFKEILIEYKDNNKKQSRRNPSFNNDPWHGVPFIYEIVKIEEIGMYK